MFLGWFSPNQAAGVGAAGALGLGLLHRALTWPKFMNASKEGVRTACMIMLLIAGASVFGKFMAITTIPAKLSFWVSALPLSPFGILMIICLFYLISGCFIDAMALIMLTIPIIYPLVLELNYDPIWFGVVIVLISQIAVVTPPVGVNVYVVKGIEPDVPIARIFRGTFPFLVAMVILLAVILCFPNMVLWFPKLLTP
jgi:C4-dicarboxylate transporter, DctM subunit